MAHTHRPAHGHCAHTHHPAAQGHHLSHGEEELHVVGQDACAEAETRRGHQAVRQARGCYDEAAGSDADVCQIWCVALERLLAHADTDAYLDCHVQL